MKTTAEEFFRNKIKEIYERNKVDKPVITLSRELMNAEEAMRWAHEFKELHLLEYASIKEDKWISVETPPKEDGEYLAYNLDNEKMSVQYFNGKHWGSLFTVHETVTHWLPKSVLPSPPKA